LNIPANKKKTNLIEGNPLLMMTQNGKIFVLEKKVAAKKKDRHGNGEL
jgi:succinyl-CoA synthetase beta subunit